MVISITAPLLGFRPLPVATCCRCSEIEQALRQQANAMIVYEGH
jgi:hypothetical protein